MRFSVVVRFMMRFLHSLVLLWLFLVVVMCFSSPLILIRALMTVSVCRCHHRFPSIVISSSFGINLKPFLHLLILVILLHFTGYRIQKHQFVPGSPIKFSTFMRLFLDVQMTSEQIKKPEFIKVAGNREFSMELVWPVCFK